MRFAVAYNDEQPLTELGGGVARKVLSHDERMMVVEVRFLAGAVGATHSHPHAQCSYVRSGRFRYTVLDESVEIGPGDAVTVPGGLPHGTLCLAAGTLVDVFTPARQDFI